MMDCPKCGFNQPNDKYCAKCGVDVEEFRQKPPNVFKRVANSSNVHLAVIIGVIVGTLFYLFISQRELIQQEVGRIFDGIPILSSRSLDEVNETEPLVARESEVTPEGTETSSLAAEPQGIIEPSANTGQPEAQKPPSIEVRYLEISKENLRALITTGQVIREFENWRVVYIPSSPSIQSLLQSSRPLPGSVRQALPAQGELEILSGDFDPEPNRSFLNFSMIWRMPDNVDWSLISQMRTAEVGGPPELALREFDGKIKWTPQGALILIFDPIQRVPVSADSDLTGSPLRVLQSQDFQNGLSDLIIWVEIKNLPAIF